MRILFDQGTPGPLRRHLTEHTVDTAFERGESNLRNGELLDHAEMDGYQLLVTTDQSLRYQQNLTGRNLAIEAKIAGGEEELIPAVVVDRLLAGEAPLRVWREFRRLTQVALAEASGVNRVQIVEIEAGRGTGSVRTLCKLAAALAIDVDDLIRKPA